MYCSTRCYLFDASLDNSIVRQMYKTGGLSEDIADCALEVNNTNDIFRKLCYAYSDAIDYNCILSIRFDTTQSTLQALDELEIEAINKKTPVQAMRKKLRELIKQADVADSLIQEKHEEMKGMWEKVLPWLGKVESELKGLENARNVFVKKKGCEYTFAPRLLVHPDEQYQDPWLQPTNSGMEMNGFINLKQYATLIMSHTEVARKAILDAFQGMTDRGYVQIAKNKSINKAVTRIREAMMDPESARLRRAAEGKWV